MENLRTKIFVSVVITLFLIAIYFIRFNGSLSDNSQDWANFGSYCSCIVTFLNVYIFYQLTLSIQLLNKRLKEKESKEQILSQERERKHQKNLILTDLRYRELKLLSEVLSDFTPSSMNKLPHSNFIKADFAIRAFANEKTNLFPFLKDSDNPIFNKINKLCEILMELTKIVNASMGNNEIGVPVSGPHPLPKEYNESMNKYITLKIEILTEIEKFIIAEIDNT